MLIQPLTRDGRCSVPFRCLGSDVSTIPAFRHSVKIYLIKIILKATKINELTNPLKIE
jgi:hypothetical protein